MKSVLASAAAALLLASNAAAQFMINTPNSPIVCQPLLLTWVGGQAPYFLSVVPGGQPTAAPLLNFGEQTGTQFSWPKLNFTVGTTLGLNLKDSSGVVAQSGPFTVQPGSDLSCLSGSGGSDSSTTSAGTGSTPAGSSTVTTTPGTSTSAAATGSVTTTGTATGTSTTPGSTSKTSTSSAAPSASSPASGALGNTANAVVAGIFGVGSALFALAL